MALTPLEETTINTLLVAMFNSSAANHFQEIENFFLVNGNDLSLLAVQLGTTGIFEAQFSGLSNEEQAESMLQRFGLTNDNVAGSAGSIAYAYFIKSIENGVNQSDILLAASNYLTNITGRDPIFKDTATLLENKASVAQELSDRGVIYSELSAKVLTLVTLDLNSVSAAKAIVNLIPTGTAPVTANMLNTISSIMDNVKSIADSGTAEAVANLASYLESVGTQISTATPTSLASILTVIHSVTTSPESILENDQSAVTTFTGTLATAIDLNTKDTFEYSLVPETTSVDNNTVTITDANITITTAGTYTLEGNFEALATNEIATVTFNYITTDNSGASNAISEASTVTVKITGTNDAPIITGTGNAVTGAVVEDSTDSAQATGTITFSDVDISDTHTASFSRNTQAIDNGDATDDHAVTMGTFSLVVTQAGDTTGADGSVVWTYEIDESAAQELAAGQTITEVYSVTVIDGQGGTVTQDVSVTVTGTNDAALIRDINGEAVSTTGYSGNATTGIVTEGAIDAAYTAKLAANIAALTDAQALVVIADDAQTAADNATAADLTAAQTNASALQAIADASDTSADAAEELDRVANETDVVDIQNEIDTLKDRFVVLTNDLLAAKEADSVAAETDANEIWETKLKDLPPYYDWYQTGGYADYASETLAKIVIAEAELSVAEEAIKHEPSSAERELLSIEIANLNLHIFNLTKTYNNQTVYEEWVAALNDDSIADQTSASAIGIERNAVEEAINTAENRLTDAKNADTLASLQDADALRNAANNAQTAADNAIAADIAAVETDASALQLTADLAITQANAAIADDLEAARTQDIVDNIGSSEAAYTAEIAAGIAALTDAQALLAIADNAQIAADNAAAADLTAAQTDASALQAIADASDTSADAAEELDRVANETDVIEIQNEIETLKDRFVVLTNDLLAAKEADNVAAETDANEIWETKLKDLPPYYDWYQTGGYADFASETLAKIVIAEAELSVAEKAIIQEPSSAERELLSIEIANLNLHIFNLTKTYNNQTVYEEWVAALNDDSIADQTSASAIGIERNAVEEAIKTAESRLIDAKNADNLASLQDADALRNAATDAKTSLENAIAADTAAVETNASALQLIADLALIQANDAIADDLEAIRTQGIAESKAMTQGSLRVDDIDDNQNTFMVQAGTDGFYGTFTIDALGDWIYKLDYEKSQAIGVEVVIETFAVVSKDGTTTELVTINIYGSDDAPVIYLDNPTGTETLYYSDVDGGSINLGDIPALATTNSLDIIELTGTTALNISLEDVINFTDEDNTLVIHSTDNVKDTIDLDLTVWNEDPAAVDTDPYISYTAIEITGIYTLQVDSSILVS